MCPPAPLGPPDRCGAGRPDRFALRGYRLELALMLAPYLAGLALLVVGPALLTVGLAFTEFDGLRPPRWLGPGNLLRMLRDPDFWNGLRASLFFVVLAVPLRLLVALGLAALFRRAERGSGPLRAAVYLPTVMPDVAYALFWLYIFNPTFGPLNFLLPLFPPERPFGIEAAEWAARPAWLIHGGASQVAIVIMSIWTIGEGFVLLMAALQTIPRSLYEAAALDGAGAWRQFRLVTLPWLAPFLLLLACRDTILSFQANFTAAILVTKGGPNYATSYLPYWIYLNVADYQRLGYGAAMTLAMLLISGLIVVLQFRYARRWRAAYYD